MVVSHLAFLGLLMSPPSEEAVVVSLDDLATGSIQISVPWAKDGPLYLEDEGNTALADRCVLQVHNKATRLDRSSPTACLAFFSKKPSETWLMHQGDQLVLSGSLEVEKAIESTIKIKWTEGSDSSAELIPPKWPKKLADLNRLDFKVQVDTVWVTGALTKDGSGNVLLSPPILTRESGDSDLDIWTKLHGRLTKLTLRVEQTTTATSTPGEVGPTDLTQTCNSEEIRAEARAAVGLPGPGAPAQPPANDRIRKLLLSDWFYIQCYDLTNPNVPKLVTLTHPEEVATALESEYGLKPADTPTLFTNHDIVVVVWAKSGTKVDIDIAGDPSWSSSVYIPPGALEAADSADAPVPGAPPAPPIAPHKVQRFAPRGGTHIKVEIKGLVKPPDKNEETVFEYENVRRLESLHSGAIRVGVAFSWSPWERTYEAVTGPGGVRYVGYDAGNEPIGKSKSVDAGLLDVELTFGYTQFFRLLPSQERGARGGWYFGAGLVKAGQGGVSVLNSIHTGPELIIGRTFGIALTASLRRTRWLDSDYKIGSPLPTGDPPTRFGVTPVFSILVNLQPAILKTVGKVDSRYTLFGGNS